MKDLPKVYHCNIDKKLNNNETIFYSDNKNIEVDSKTKTNEIDSKNIVQKINSIFSSPSYVYKASVEITLKDKTITKRIIGRNKDFIITMDNDLIPIKDIMDIKSIKK